MLNGHQVIGVTAGEHTVVSLSTGEVIGCGANHNGQLGLFRSFFFIFGLLVSGFY
jgi:alpha-tubulin suppressor-like RCC1 family protein